MHLSSGTGLQPEINAGAVLAFIDTETTGLTRDDRIISLAIATLKAEDLQTNRFRLRTTHLIFNPGRRCHPRAAAVHGWDDRTLSKQARFGDHMKEVSRRLADADIWLMHNATFDRRFLTQEFDALGRALPKRPTFCTMVEARSRWPNQSARLDDCVGRIGLARRQRAHGALEDALLTAALFSFYQTGRKWKTIPTCSGPTNLR